MAKTLDAVIRLTDNYSATMEKISGATERFSKIGQMANNQTEQLTSTLKRIAGVAGGALAIDRLVEGFKGIATKGIEGAASLESYRNTLNVVMKDQQKAAETFKWAVDFANKTPFETDEMVEATVKLQSYGLTAQDVMTDIGNMAGVMNKSLDRAVEAVADAQNGELERLKEFGISKQMIIDQGNKIMKNHEIVNNKGQITDQKSFNKALFSLMQERYKGGMELQANSYKGLMSTIQGVYSTGLAKIMGITSDGSIKAGSIFDNIKKKVKTLGDTMQKLEDDGTIEKWGKKATDIFNDVDKIMTNQVIPALKDVGSYAADALKWISDHKETVKTLTEIYIGWKGAVLAVEGAYALLKIAQKAAVVLEGIETLAIIALYGAEYIATAATGALTTAQWLLNAAMEANPFVATATLILGSLWILYEVAKHYDQITAAVDRACDKIREFAKLHNVELGGSGSQGLAVDSGKTTYTPGKTLYGGSRAIGEKRVPKDGTVYTLHQGETVLTARESRERDKGLGTISIGKLADTIVVREEADIDKIATALARKIKLTSMNMA